MSHAHLEYYLTCVSCGKKTSEKETVSTCLSCGGPLDVVYDYDRLKSSLNMYLLRSAPPKTMKYLDFYPLRRDRQLYSLDEGGTSLLSAHRLAKKLGLKKLFIKNEGLNPTGAFKDRGSFVEINKAKELGFSSIVVASTGNMAASVSAYCAQAGLDCYVFVPENTPRGKLAQSLSYGAKVIQIRGTYNDAARLAQEVSKKYHYYLAGDYVFRLEGQKSAGYEIAEQMWREPVDWIIVPVGMGTNLSAIYKGLWEYKNLGLIDTIPRMVAVQATGAHSIIKTKNLTGGTNEGSQSEASQLILQTRSPSERTGATALKQRLGNLSDRTRLRNTFTILPVSKPQTICSAIAVGDPLDGPKVINALSKTGGTIETATDDETLAAQQLLAHLEALYIEPSAATTLVALEKLLNNHTIKSSDTVVCIATGAGLKDPAATLKVLAEPPTIEPDLSEVNRVISNKLFSIRAQAVKEKEKILFNALPTQEIVEKVVKKEFTLSLSKKNIEIVRTEISTFISKGKLIAKADMQSILENTIQQESRKQTLILTDFRVVDSKHKRPTAHVEVLLNGKKYIKDCEGVGPVDAAITAMKSIIDEHDGIDFRLTDFTVEIPTTGADSTVEVTMILQSTDGTSVVEKGTSPDIFVASLNAYVAGYNELVYQRSRKDK